MLLQICVHVARVGTCGSVWGVYAYLQENGKNQNMTAEISSIDIYLARTLGSLVGV